ncbi:hypothetical protein XFF6992_230025 [Xanthomonas citri pv. fuscans]|nr:hypothetical protein XFF6992_230025 [Xanthomonas citri pv. fuscans]
MAAMMRSVIGVCVLPETAWSVSQPLGDVESFSNGGALRGKRAVIRACRERAAPSQARVVHGSAYDNAAIRFIRTPRCRMMEGWYRTVRPLVSVMESSACFNAVTSSRAPR